MLGIINNEQQFLNVCKALDVLYGRKTHVAQTDSIVYDKTRYFYFDLIVILLKETKLNLKELERVMQVVIEKRNNTKPLEPSTTVSYLLPWCRHTSFEPTWHMKMRGDDKPLPNKQGKDLWGYLLGLYTNPEKVRLREPDYIASSKHLFKGYEDCLRRARRAATEEMKLRYGDDVDLSPVTDLPKHADFYESSFIDMLIKGENPYFS